MSRYCWEISTLHTLSRDLNELVCRFQSTPQSKEKNYNNHKMQQQRKLLKRDSPS